MNDYREFFQPQASYAVVGATTNRAKYGYRVLKDLQLAGLQVVGVNPKYQEIEGVSIYPTIANIPEKPDIVVSVVPPAVGVSIVDQAAAAGISKLWFQPGAESETIRSRCEAKGLTCVANGACIMIERHRF